MTMGLCEQGRRVGTLGHGEPIQWLENEHGRLKHGFWVTPCAYSMRAAGQDRVCIIDVDVTSIKFWRASWTFKAKFSS
jgi:hypothetical protein